MEFPNLIEVVYCKGGGFPLKRVRKERTRDAEYNIIKKSFDAAASFAKRLASPKYLAVLCALLLAAILFRTGFLSPGYNAYIGTKNVGMVKDMAHVQRVVSLANKDLPEPVEEEINLYPRLIIAKGYTSDEALVRGIKLADGQVFEGVAFFSDGESIFALDDEKEMDGVIEEYISRYKSADTLEARLEDEVQTDKGLFPSGIRVTREQALELLEKKEVGVITTESIFTVEAVGRPTEQTYDDSQAIGNVIVNTEGADGEKEVNKIVVKRNGEVIREQIIDENITALPVARVEVVGTFVPEGHGSGVFQRPHGGEITSHFGPRWGKEHQGTDFAGVTGEAVKAADSGTVIFSGSDAGFGNLIIIDHKNGFKTYYAHLNARYVNLNDAVDAGQVIGELGNTGNSTGPHLHFEIHKDGIAEDPMGYLQA